MKIVIINGEGRVGKDTFVHFCSQIDPYIVYGVSIIDEVKAGAVHFNWDREDKSEKARKFLSDLKDAWEEFNDGPYETVKWRIGLIEQIHEFQKNLDKVIVFIHSREPDDIERFVNDYKAITLTIDVADVETVDEEIEVETETADDIVYETNSDKGTNENQTINVNYQFGHNNFNNIGSLTFIDKD